MYCRSDYPLDLKASIWSKKQYRGLTVRHQSADERQWSGWKSWGYGSQFPFMYHLPWTTHTQCEDAILGDSDVI